MTDRLGISRSRIPLANGFELSRVTGSILHSFPFHCESAIIAPSGEIDYSTPLTDDVEVRITPEEEEEFLARAHAWAANHENPH